MKFNKRFDTILRQAKDADIRVKILLPSLLLLVLPFATIVLIGNNVYNQQQQEDIQHRIERAANNVKTMRQALSEQALYAAQSFAGNPQVRKAFQAYHNDTIPDLESSMMLQYAVRPILRNISREGEDEMRLHFYVPPAISFLRSWSNERMDDLSTLRKSVLSVTNTGDPFTGIEIGFDGAYIRGITSIKQEEGNVAGAVEVMLPLDYLLERLNLPQQEEMALYLDAQEMRSTEAKEEMATTQDTSATRFVLVDYSSESFNFNQISDKDLVTPRTSGEGQHTIERGEYQFTMLPFRDARDHVIGYAVHQLYIGNYISDVRLMYASEFWVFFFFALLGTIAMLIVTTIIMSPVTELQGLLEQFNKGDFSHSLRIRFRDQLGTIITQILTHRRELNKKTKFIKALNQEDFTAQYTPLSEEDDLGKELEAFRDNLKVYRENEAQRKKEDDRRNWFNEGKSKANETLRDNSQNLQQLTDAVTKLLVAYMEASQGGLFLMEEQEGENGEKKQILQLSSIYAYEERRYQKGSVELGEGMLGMVALDQVTIYRKNIPGHFIRIRSGLGETKPNVLLIVPFVVEGETIAVLELASLKEYAPYQIQFLEEVGETVASSIQNQRISQRTEKLLNQSQRQAKELAAKEVEMRENLQTLQETEEQMQRTEEKNLATVNAFNSVLLRANFDKDGTIQFANALFLKKMKYLQTEVEGFTIYNFLPEKNERVINEFKEQWHRLIHENRPFHFETLFQTKYEPIWIHGVFASITSKDMGIEEVLFTGFDIHKQKIESIYHHNEIKAITGAVAKTVYEPNGKIVSDNKLFLNKLGYEGLATERNNIFDLLNNNEERHFRKLWNKVAEREAVGNIERIYDINGRPIWFKGIYTPVIDESGDMTHVVFLGVDVTDIFRKLPKDHPAIPEYLQDD